MSRDAVSPPVVAVMLVHHVFGLQFGCISGRHQVQARAQCHTNGASRKGEFLAGYQLLVHHSLSATGQWTRDTPVPQTSTGHFPFSSETGPVAIRR